MQPATPPRQLALGGHSFRPVLADQPATDGVLFATTTFRPTVAWRCACGHHEPHDTHLANTANPAHRWPVCPRNGGHTRTAAP